MRIKVTYFCNNIFSRSIDARPRHLQINFSRSTAKNKTEVKKNWDISERVKIQRAWFQNLSNFTRNRPRKRPSCIAYYVAFFFQCTQIRNVNSLKNSGIWKFYFQTNLVSWVFFLNLLCIFLIVARLHRIEIFL